MKKWKLHVGARNSSWFELREKGAAIKLELILEKSCRRWKATAQNVPGMNGEGFPKYYDTLDEAKACMEDWFFESLWQAGLLK